MGRATPHFFGPAPWGPHGEGPKGQISLNFNYKISKIFKPNVVCLFTNERYKTYQTGFHLAAWVMPQGWDFGAPWGLGVNFFFSEIQPDLVCELLT